MYLEAARSSLWFSDEHDPEAEVCIGVELVREKPRGRSARRVGVVVSAPADDFQSAGIGRRAGWIGLNSARLVAVPILAPLPDIPIQVIQSPRIGQLLPDRMNCYIEKRQVQEPRVIRQAGVVRVVSITEPRRGAGARGAFPLSLGRQTILAASGDAPRCQFVLRQPPAVIGRVGPAYAGNWTAQITWEFAWIRVHDRKIL